VIIKGGFMMQEVKFKVKFLDWGVGDKEKLDNAIAKRYVDMGVCSVVKPRIQKKVNAAPKNKMVTGAAKNK
jgi:hypothetical protein